MPDTQATRDALEAAGLPSIGNDGRFHFHTPDRFDLLVAVNTGTRSLTCFVAVRNMTEAEARGLIGPWLEVAEAEPASDLSGNGREVWRGRFRGGPVTLLVGDDIRLPGLRGRAIGAQGQ